MTAPDTRRAATDLGKAGRAEFEMYFPSDSRRSDAEYLQQSLNTSASDHARGAIRSQQFGRNEGKFQSRSWAGRSQHASAGG